MTVVDTVKKTTPINNNSCLEIWKLMQLLSLQCFLPYSNSRVGFLAEFFLWQILAIL
jgi:hypothetical protein